MMAGTKLMPVHYRGGGDTIKDLLSGQVKVMFSSIAPVINLIKEGKLVGIATTGSKREPSLPDLPTVAEAGVPGFETYLWIGLSARAGTPKAILDKLARANAQAVPRRTSRKPWRSSASSRGPRPPKSSMPSTAPSATSGPRSSRKPGWTRNSGPQRAGFGPDDGPDACSRGLRLAGTRLP